VKDLIKLLVALQNIDSRILEKRLFIDKVPMRVFEVDEPLKHAGLELDKIKQKNEALLKKKREKEKMLEETGEKIKKMRARVSEIKTNKEYQAHLKEIEASEKEISAVEDEILVIMEDFENSTKQQKEKEEKVNVEVEKINAFKRQLDAEVEKYEKELASLKEERKRLAASIDPEVYNVYMALLVSGGGVAVTRAKNEICLGCNMNIPPQLFVEIRKNEEIIQCTQCRRILYYFEEQ
jgi:predicted  nucleic acid-binding Zn-ribbon protein